MTILLRSYQASDFELLVTLWFETWHQTYPDLRHPLKFGQWKTLFEQRRVHNQIWVAENEQGIAGFMAIRNSGGYLEHLFVTPNAQKQGVGTALLNKAKELSPAGLTLDTLQRNSNGRRFYERHGFLPGRTGINQLSGQPNIAYSWQP